MKDTAIEWAENTINFYMGCTKVSPGCAVCYMFRLMKTFGKDPGKLNKMNFPNVEKNLKSWPASRIFVNSMSDTFHEDLSFAEIDEMFNIMFKYPQHQYLILTKRIMRAKEYFDVTPCPQNFWIGTSIESEAYTKRAETLKEIPAGVRFISYEPLLGKIKSLNLDGIQWVIVGGESDYNQPRRMEGAWVDEIWNACQEQKVPFFFKQRGGRSKCVCHKAWGCRLLFGKTWDELPVIIA